MGKKPESQKMACPPWWVIHLPSCYVLPPPLLLGRPFQSLQMLLPWTLLQTAA